MDQSRVLTLASALRGSQIDDQDRLLKRQLTRLLMLMNLVVIAPLRAQETSNAEAGTHADGAEQVSEATDAGDSQKENNDVNATDVNAPEAANLRNRALGDAFENFQPSEDISADNAVKFPVDI